MNCHDIQEALIDELYHDLAAPTRREVEAHCAACADCSWTWASLQAMHQALHQWTDVTPPPGLRARVLAQVAVRREEGRSLVWLPHKLASTGAAVTAGLALMVLTVLLLSRSLALDVFPPRALLICGSLWGGVYVGLFGLTFSNGVWKTPRWVPEGPLLVGAARMALLAVGIATLVLVLVTILPLTPVLIGLTLPPRLTVVSAGVIALVALGISSWCLGRMVRTPVLLHTLLAACLFVLAVAPGLLMFCVPLTLGAYIGLLLAVGAGASAGGALGALLGSRGLHYAQG